jgi:predicted ATPase/DNA-binding SARP family transcriptional activator
MLDRTRADGPPANLTAVTIELVLLSRVSYRGQEITGSRLQGLLALLAEDPHAGCSAARLADALWPDEQPEHPAKALQVLVSRARARLGPGVIASTPGGYRLSLSADQIDASAVLLSVAESAKRSQAGDHLAALGHAEAGLALCEGAEGWDTGNGHPLSAHSPAAGPLEALRAARVPAYRSLQRARALALSRLGRRAEAAAPLGELNQRYPRDEEVLAELLRSEAATAGPAAALARYAGYRQWLRDDLGSDPGPALQGVYQELLQADAPVIRRGVRHEPNPLLGRDDDIAAVTSLLRNSRVTSIVGPGGLGKTRLAHAVSSQAEQRVVYFVELAGVAADGDVTAEVAAALGAGEDGAGPPGRGGPPGGAPPGGPAGIVAALGPGPALLVLDNCEHVVPSAAGLVYALVSLSKDLRVLTTSRAPLGLSSESVYLLPELDLPTAVELFEQRARAARPDADLPAEAVSELCARLEGLPLAVELAAARIRVMSVAEIARRLDDRFAVLRGGARDAPQRHRTLHAVIDWSWTLLDPAGQAAMRALSVFPGGFTAGAAQHLLAAGPLRGSDVLVVLEQLADQSLLKVSDTAAGARYRMLETVREFAAARREDAGETEAVTSRFVAWARDFGAAHHDFVLTGGDLPAFELIRAEQDNMVLALRHGLDRKEAGTVAAVSAVLGSLWMAESNFTRSNALAADTSGVLARYRPEPGLVEATRTSLVLGVISGLLLGGPNPARFLVGLRRLPPAPPDGFARAVQAVLNALTGPPEADLAALEAMGQSDQPLLAGMAGTVASYLLEAAGDLDGALAAARRALAAFERRGSVWLLIAGHSRIGELCLQVDEPEGDEALHHLGTALSMAEVFGARASANRLREAMVLANLQRGAFDEAERELKLTTPRNTDEPWNMSMFDTAVRAEIALGRGDTEEGLRLWRTAAAALRGPSVRPDLSRLDPWALDIQVMAVVAHARHGRLDPVAEITSVLPATLSVLTAEMGPPSDSPLASWPGISVYGSLLLALAMTDIARARNAASTVSASTVSASTVSASTVSASTVSASTGLARSGARMVALAERFGIQQGFGPTSSAARARRAAQDADGPAYDDAVSSYAGLDPGALRGAARAALRERAQLSG